MDSITKKCSKCNEIKNVSEFMKKTRTCKNCGRIYRQAWRDKNREKVRAYTNKRRLEYPEQDKKERKKYRETHKEQRRADNIERNKRNRLIVINAYGGKCACCGETILEFLAIDHINNDGNVMRKNKVHPENPCSWLIKNGFPKDSFQILCHNCNASKEYYGYCPHEKLREVSKTT